ncbi:testis development-related protein-like [Paramormyrops kingsleyae]|uniref:testis development-related protein-like n=1 Tax=Paramormyrops kingsleyae TaxID=1676925 RepID=UPI003B96DD44
MFRKHKSKVLIDYASEEDDMLCSHRRTFKYKDPDGKEEITNSGSKQIKSKKSKSKREKNKKALFKDEDERTLLTAASENGKGSSKKHKDRERKKSYIERGHCLWDSITMSMRQITPAKRVGKTESWEAAHPSEVTGTVGDGNVDATLQLDRCSSWTGAEEDSSRYTNLIESKIPSIQWTARAKGRLAVIRRRSREGVSERWEGLK